jgi:hypothetical protein
MTGQAGLAPVIALAHVFANGTLFVQKGFSAIAPHVPGSGTYQLTLATPPVPIDNAIVVATPFGGASGINVLTAPTDQVFVSTFDTTTEVPADSDFMVVVFDATP